MSEDLDQLVNSNTRDELDALATEAGVEAPEDLANKEEVAQAILDARGDTEAPAGDEEPSEGGEDLTPSGEDEQVPGTPDLPGPDEPAELASEEPVEEVPEPDEDDPGTGGPETITDAPQTPQQEKEEVTAAPSSDGALNQEDLPGGAAETEDPDETDEEREFRLTFEHIPEDDEERLQTARDVWDSQKELEEKINSLPGYIDGA